MHRRANLIKRSTNTLHNTRYETRLMSASETNLCMHFRSKREGRWNVVNAQQKNEIARYGRGVTRGRRETWRSWSLVVNYWSEATALWAASAGCGSGAGAVRRGRVCRGHLPRAFPTSHQFWISNRHLWPVFWFSFSAMTGDPMLTLWWTVSFQLFSTYLFSFMAVMDSAHCWIWRLRIAGLWNTDFSFILFRLNQCVLT